jgi:long-subunit fatty acid transport protein
VVFPPDASDPTSLNKFLYVVYTRPGADTLALPDSVAYQHIEDRTWQAAGGFSWHLPGHRGLLGAEYHAEQDERTGIPVGYGPLVKQWDLRAGLEYRCTPVLTGRGGYIYTSRNQDDLTAQNEYLSNAGTLGFTYRPRSAIWDFDAGYSIEWWRADYGTPAQPRGSRQQLLGQLRWQF